jgi:Tol biopolymer transport system component
MIVTRRSDGVGRIDTVGAGVWSSFTPDGRDVVYTEIHGPQWNLVRAPVDRSSSPVMLIAGQERAGLGRVSPDGRFIAYASDETGHWEIYVAPYPGGQNHWQVSNEGGSIPRWSPKGDRLYFANGLDLYEVAFEVHEGTPRMSVPTRVLTRPQVNGSNFGLDAFFEVSPDGNRFLSVRSANQRHEAAALEVVQNWMAEFRGAAK